MESPKLKPEEKLTKLQKIMTDVRFEQLTNPELIGKKIVYIMRGASGSGKSTVAREVANPDGIIHSTDSKFYDEKGNYNFDPKKLPEYHDSNFTDFCKKFRRGSSCSNT